MFEVIGVIATFYVLVGCATFAALYFSNYNHFRDDAWVTAELQERIGTMIVVMALWPLVAYLFVTDEL